MQHDVKAEAEGNHEARVPKQEEEEGLENLVEHDDIHVVPRETGVASNKCYKFGPNLKT
jgi:hypothetical protein